MRKPGASIVFIVLLSLVAGCTTTTTSTAVPPTASPAATATPPLPVSAATPTTTATTSQVPVEAVRFTTEDGVTLSGTLFGEGEIAVVLAHQGTTRTDQQSWQPFAQLIAQKGFTALTFDFRGRGQSEGVLQTNLLVNDVNAAIRFLRDRGYDRIICMGASMGGTACARAALDNDLAGLAVIASTMSNGAPTEVKPEDLPKLTMPKLFVVAERENSAVVRDTTRMFELSPEPKRFKSFAGRYEHGTYLFSSPVGDEFRDLLIKFLEDVRTGRLTAGAITLTPVGSGARGDGLYLGQKPPGLDVEVFASGVVSIEDGKEYKIAFSPDLQEIFFTRRTPKGRDDRLWTCRLENGKLTVPELAPFAYDTLETDACFTPDGNRLYFNSARPLPGETTASRLPNVWFVDRTETGWSEPRFLGPLLNDYQPVYFSFADDGTLYFTRSSPRGIYYVETKDGQYQEAQRLPDEINYVREVAHPAVAPDESYIVVDSAYERGDRLVGSLYVSFKRPDGSWTRAVSMHDALKASEADVYAIPRITPDGKYLFFERYEAKSDRSDIYWVSTEVIEGLRARVLPQ